MECGGTVGRDIQNEPLNDQLKAQWASWTAGRNNWAAGQNTAGFEQDLKVETDSGRTTNFRARARNICKFFDSLAEARDGVQHMANRDCPEISLEESVGGVWELREIHIPARS